METSKKTTRVDIPHTHLQDVTLVGTLEQLAPEQPTHGRKIALILHGTMGHKDYLFQKRLAQKLPLDSFRFDFRGAHESSGTWNYAGVGEDVEDLRVVVAYLVREYGYVVDLVVGHSRGSVAGMYWLCTSEEGRRVGGMVNVSGRYRMDRVLQDRPPEWLAGLRDQGYFEWRVTVARKPLVVRITAQDMDAFARWDTSIVWERFPARTDVLTVHGLRDMTVPAYDAFIYARAFAARSPGTHNLHVVEEGDHNLTGHFDHVVETVLDWWAARERDELRTGVWGTGERPGSASKL
ncbi:ectomycorrhiza-regulated esterase [Amylostereum chailletii]|nr:ectomycorrhiza-regulated esterase [Amylostereum chailletii]